MKRDISFKSNSRDQFSIIPQNISDLIPSNHPSRIVDKVINKINLEPLIKDYKGGGTSSYHPKTLLKILVYSYLSNIYSSRKIETALHENVTFMWLSGMNKPDHSTINNFRGKRLKNKLKDIFTQVVLLLVEEGYVNIKELYTDGTKIESNANKYSFVWGKAIATNKEKIKTQLSELWQYVEEVYKKEQEEQPSKPDFTEISAEKVEAAIVNINEALKDKDIKKKVKQKLNYAAKNWPLKLEEYAEKEVILGDRNSYSKTDHDATFMRTKDDHMQNAQLKACYNIQYSTNNRFFVNYTVHQTPTDTTTYQLHHDEYERMYGDYPEIDTADAGYGSEENYEYAEKNKIEAFVKYNYFHKEQNKKFKEDAFKKENLYYNINQDCYYCPMGQKMKHIQEKKSYTKTGYKQNLSIYEAENCNKCQLRCKCFKGKGNRQIQVNKNLERLKHKARNKLLSEEGIKRRKQRAADVESSFGNLKQNQNFRRFMLRGLEKVEIEVGLLALSQNLKKIAV